MPYACGMGKARGFILWLAAVALLLLLTAHFTLRHALNTPKFKAAVTGFLARTTGRTADYERIDYSIRPVSLIVRNATLTERDAAQHFASVRAFSLVLDWRRKELAALRLERPTLRIRQRPDGTFNISDWFAGPPRTTEAGVPAPGAPPTSGSATPPPASRPAASPSPSFSLRRVEIHEARIEFLREAATEARPPFVVSNLTARLLDPGQDKALRLTGSARIGRASTVQFDLSGPAPPAFVGRPEAWPLALQAQLDIGDFADIRPYLPPGARPFHKLSARLHVQGALADRLDVRLHGQTSPASASHPAAARFALAGDVVWPAPEIRHPSGDALQPENMPPHPDPGKLPAGTITPAPRSRLAAALKNLRASF